MAKINEMLALIPKGKEQAIPGPVLAARVQFADERSLRAAIAKARADGEIICSGACGYYRPETLEEIVEYVQMMERHAKSCFLAIRSARARLKEIHGQLHVDNPDDMELIMSGADHSV